MSCIPANANEYKKKLNPQEWDDFCRQHPRLTEICSDLKEDDNPVLLRIKVKDF